MAASTIDREALNSLLEVIGGDPEDLADLIDDFLETAPDLVAQIMAGVGTGDHDSVRIAAHTLKSNARDFGAIELSELAGKLETTSKDHEQLATEAASVQLEALAQTALEALTEIKAAGLG